jgi:hypothetical protein
MVMKNLAVPLVIQLILIVPIILIVLVLLVVLVVLEILLILVGLVGRGSEVQFEPADPPDMYGDGNGDGTFVSNWPGPTSWASHGKSLPTAWKMSTQGVGTPVLGVPYLKTL